MSDSPAPTSATPPAPTAPTAPTAAAFSAQTPAHVAQPDTPHARLVAALRENATFRSAMGTLGWDEQTQLPAEATTLRADQLALLARLHHERATSRQLGELIEAAEADVQAESPANESDEATVARAARRDYDRATKLPASLVEAMARAEVIGHAAWVEARKNNNYGLFTPHLVTQLDLKRQEIECVGYKQAPYDALLDIYEPEETAAGVTAVFEGFKAELIELVGRIIDSGRTPDRSILTRSYPVAEQEVISRKAAEAFGFRFPAGRLDVAVHPFCSGLGPGDTRMTTRFDEHEIANSLFSTLHETGHALYEQGLPKVAYFGTGPGESISLGIHESQSRLWENLVGRSRAYWEYFWPTLQASFKDSLWEVTLDEFLFAVNDIHPSFIRTESDEATYNLHILMRFELEQALLSGDLPPAELPEAWDERMRSYLGITPPQASQGCLQDVHWSIGLIGYFPTYTLGNLYAAQLFEAARWELGDLDAMFTKGEFTPLLHWLRTKIHHLGQRYSARDLIRHITGQPLSAVPLMAHLKRKAAEFYGV